MQQNNSNTGLVIALLGGGALIWWLLGRGGRGSGGSSSADNGTPAPSESHTPASRSILQLRVDDRIELDGSPTDLPTAIARARDVGKVEVRVSGDTRQGWYNAVVNALLAAGVEVVHSETVPGYNPPAP